MPWIEPAAFTAPDSNTVRLSLSRTITCSQTRREGYAVGSLWPPRFSTATSASSRPPRTSSLPIETRAALRLKMRHRPLRRRRQFLRQRRDAQLVAVAVQHSLHEEVAAHEHVPRNPRPRLAQHAA